MAVASSEPSRSGDGHLETIRLTWDRFRAWDDNHRMVSDAGIVLVVAGACFVAFSPRFWFHRPSDIVLQLALIVPLAWRRRSPSVVFCCIAAVAFVQWLVTMPLPADVALLIALFTLAVHATLQRALLGTAVLEVGAVLAAVRWAPAGDVAKSLLFLTGLVAAALFIGITMRTLRAYTDSLVERAKRLEFERDQQAQIASAAERSRIAREMHDVVAHNVAIMVTLADGARTVAASDPARAQEAMGEVSEAGRIALADMRHLLGVLRTGNESVGRSPQPQLSDLPQLIQGVRATGLEIDVAERGQAFEVPAGAGLTVYRIVQESLTNVVKHASEASMVKIDLMFDAPLVTVSIRDDGHIVTQCAKGHGLDGMRERAALYGGELTAGPGAGGGWEVTAKVRAEA
jgi:signal transduction histidine kinase